MLDFVVENFVNVFHIISQVHTGLIYIESVSIFSISRLLNIFGESFSFFPCFNLIFRPHLLLFIELLPVVLPDFLVLELPIEAIYLVALVPVSEILEKLLSHYFIRVHVAQVRASDAASGRNVAMSRNPRNC